MHHQVLTSRGDQYTQVCTFTHEEMLALKPLLTITVRIFKELGF